MKKIGIVLFLLVLATLFFPPVSRAAEKFLVLEDVSIEGKNFFEGLPHYFQQMLKVKLQEKGFSVISAATAEGVPRLKVRLIYQSLDSGAGHLTGRVEFYNSAGKMFKIGGSPLAPVSIRRQQGIEELVDHIISRLLQLWGNPMDKRNRKVKSTV